MFVAVDGKLWGLLGVADLVKATTADAIRALHAEGVRIVMLTGDSRATAEAVARSLGIDDVIAEVLPEQKAAEVKRLQKEGHVVAMAGDGINDAPALVQAEIGIAMGTGTDIAMESADVTLLKEPGHDVEHQADPVLRVRLQRSRHTARGRRSVSPLRAAAESDDRGGGHVVQLGLSHRKRAAVAVDANLAIDRAASSPV